MSSRKRKHASRKRERFSNTHIHDEEPTLDPALFIQAYEADIIRGPRGHAAALSLEIRDVGGETDIGSGLIQLGGDEYIPSAFPEDEDSSEQMRNSKDQAEAIWVDRYDARLLLDPEALLNVDPKVQPRTIMPSSPTGWSDLPSDTEDTFFFTAEETDDYRREKRRRLMEQNREERLKARMEEDGEEVWGGSDEEPEESQKEIMRRTANHLIASPNSAQLEMRILANHGGDSRFAFLRGRWSRTWKIIQAHARADKLKEKHVPQANSLGMGLVADYGDSDVSEGETQAEEAKGEIAVPISEPQKDEEDIKGTQEIRRARAREWMASRKLSEVQ